MSRKLRFALLALVVCLAVPAGAAKAVSRMPIGFYDDPSFRWAANPTINLASAQRAHASIIHVLAYWASIAPTKPANPLSGADPAYNLSDLDSLVSSAQAYGQQVLLTISGTPKWANGDQTPNHAPKNVNDLTEFAHMLAARYNGTHAGFGTVSRFSVWNEPNLRLFLTPQFEGKRIVSPGIYATLYEAAYKGIKAGNPKALVAAGETSNRGHNHPTGIVSDSVAPATFAHLLSVVAPTIRFDAWATHPYPSIDRLGPAQKVSYPNVTFSTMSKFGASLQQWFHRRVPIWVTEYAEQTKPEKASGVTYAQQSADVRKALQLAQANPYVEMFIWFVFRDSTSKTWFSGIEKNTGARKPAYASFANTAKGIDGMSQIVAPGKRFSVTLPVPIMTYHNAVGKKVGVTYKIYSGKTVLWVGQPLLPIQANEAITIPVTFVPVKGKSYVMTVVVNDKTGFTETHTIALIPSA